MRSARVIYHEEEQGWWAESPEVPGWSGAGPSFDEVSEMAKEGLPFFAEEELQLLHLKVGKEQVPMPATAGTPSRHVILEAPSVLVAPHFEKQESSTAGAENDTVSA